MWYEADSTASPDQGIAFRHARLVNVLHHVVSCHRKLFVLTGLCVEDTEWMTHRNGNSLFMRLPDCNIPENHKELSSYRMAEVCYRRRSSLAVISRHMQWEAEQTIHIISSYKEYEDYKIFIILPHNFLSLYLYLSLSLLRAICSRTYIIS